MILVADTGNKWITQIFSNIFICLLPQSIWETSIKSSVFWRISRIICLILELNWDFLNGLRGRPVLPNDLFIFSFESTRHNNVGLMQTWFYSHVHQSLAWTCFLDYLEQLDDNRHALTTRRSKYKNVNGRDLVCWHRWKSRTLHSVLLTSRPFGNALNRRFLVAHTCGKASYFSDRSSGRKHSCFAPNRNHWLKTLPNK